MDTCGYGTSFANYLPEWCLLSYKESLRKTYFRYSNPPHRLAVDQDSVQVSVGEQGQFNEARDLLDLLNGE